MYVVVSCNGRESDRYITNEEERDELVESLKEDVQLLHALFGGDWSIHFE